MSIARPAPALPADLPVSSIALGCWPMAGITSIGTSPEQSEATLLAAVEAGVTHFDAAHAYGYDGEVERMIGRTLGPHRDRISVATKGGLVWHERDPQRPDAKRAQSRDGRPETLRRQCDESLDRLGWDHVDVYYLHAPDPEVCISDSAGAIAELIAAGKARYAGVSNFTTREQYDAFAAECPITLDQQPWNLLQRDAESGRVEFGQFHGAAMVAYWPLMKGLLAGRLGRDHKFDPKDSRQHYSVFREPNWSRTHDLLDRLRSLAASHRCTLVQLVLAATIRQPFLRGALVGAKRPGQITETAAAMHLDLPDAVFDEIDAATQDRGPIVEV